MLDGSDKELPPGIEELTRQIAELTVRVENLAAELDRQNKVLSTVTEWIKQP